MFRLPKITAERAWRLAKEGGWIVFGQVLAAAGSLVLVRVVSEHLAPAQYGMLSLSLSLGTLVCQTSMAGAIPGVTRYFPIARENRELGTYFATAFRLVGLATIATAVLGTLTLVAVGIVMGGGWVAPVALAIFLLQITNYNGALSGIQSAARQRHIVALHGGADPWLRIGAVLVAVYALGGTEVAVIVGYIVANVLVIASQVYFASRMLRKEGQDSKVASLEPKLLASMWAFSSPFVVINAFGWAQANADRWALQTFATTEQVGIYATLMQIGFAPMTILVGVLVTFIGPILNQRAGDATDISRSSRVHRLSWILTGTCLVATAAVAAVATILHGPVFALFVAAPYRGVSHLLPWVMLAGGLIAAAQMLALRLQSEMRTRTLLAPKVLTAIGGVLLSFAGARFGGLPGLIAASLVFGAAQLIWLSVLAAFAPAQRSGTGARQGPRWGK